MQSTNTKGKILKITITSNNLNVAVTERPTYQPSEPTKISNAIGFFKQEYLKVEMINRTAIYLYY